MTAPSSDELEQALQEIRATPACRTAASRPPIGEILLNFGISGFVGQHQPVLHHVAADRRDHQQQQRHAKHGDQQRHSMLAYSDSRPGPSTRI